jgi:hypothetical protein
MSLGAFRQSNYLAAAVTGRSAVSFTRFGDTKTLTALNLSRFGTASAYFDGVGDYLLGTSSTFGTNIGTGNFTIEFWFNLPANGSPDYPVALKNSSSGDQISIRLRSTGLTDYRQNATNSIAGVGSFSFDTWNHMALVRSGGTSTLYLNGTSIGSVSDSLNLTGYNDLYIGYDPYLPGNLTGYIDELRFSKSARYTSSFTAPNNSFMDDDNTLTLLHMDGANNGTTFTDDITRPSRIAQTFATNANDTISSAQKKFGTNSLRTDNGQNRFNFNGHTDNEFTLECWFRATTFTGSTYPAPLFGLRNDSFGYFGFACAIYTGGNIITLANKAGTNYDFSLGITLATNTWYHFALTRSGTTAKIFINGTQRGGNKTVASGDMIGSAFSTDRLMIGNSTLNYWPSAGFMDEIRLSKGLRYTGNFTEPASAFVNDADTVLLSHCEVFPLVDDNG